MLDPKLLREQVDLVAEKLATRGFTFDRHQYTELEESRKHLQTQAEHIRQMRNEQSKQIGIAKGKGQDVSSLLAAVQDYGKQLDALEGDLQSVQQDMKKLMLEIPNLPHDSVPNGLDEKDFEICRTVGDIPDFTFNVKDHVDLGEHLQQMDFEAASKLSGARFVVMNGPLARLHRALAQFMLDTHTAEHGYQEVYVPLLVKHECLFGTGQLPKFAEDQFMVDGEKALALIPTGEVPVTNLARDTLFKAEELPLKWVCHTPCFRSEAGSYGKDTRGMIRQHQFEKVELVQMVRPADSYQALEALTSHAEAILQKLELPYRVIALSRGDLGFSAAKTYDLEVWLPAQKAYREISSCSNFESFQARRMLARYKDTQLNKTELIHTINGSGLAIGRTLVAIMENYQDAKGNIAIPTVLRPYMGGITTLTVATT